MTDNNIPRQLGAILDVLGLEWEQLFDKGNKDAGKDRERVLIWLYRILDTLDNKTGHLLRFTALLLAAQTFLAGILVRDSQTPRWISRFVLLLLLVPLLPPVTGLHVFWVRWKFFGTVRKERAVARDEQLIKNEMGDLAGVCDRRVTYHQWTLRFCYICIVAFVLTLVFAIKVIAPFCLC